MVANSLTKKAKVSEMLVEQAEIKLDDKFLDMATGIGEPTVTAAELDQMAKLLIKKFRNK